MSKKTSLKRLPTLIILTFISSMANINPAMSTSVDDAMAAMGVKPKASAASKASAADTAAIKKYIYIQGMYNGFDLDKDYAEKSELFSHTLFDSLFITNYQSNAVQALLVDRLPNQVNSGSLFSDTYPAISQYKYLNVLANKPFEILAAPITTQDITDPSTATLLTSITTATDCPPANEGDTSTCASIADIMSQLLSGTGETKLDTLGVIQTYGNPNALYDNKVFGPLTQSFNIQNLLNQFLLSNDPAPQGDGTLQNYANLILLLSHPAAADSSFSTDDYTAAYSKAIGAGGEAPDLTAQSVILRFLYQILSNAFYKALPINNLYNSAAMRAPINTDNGTTSRALIEYLMATWRLAPQNSSSGGTTSSWVENINKATPETVLKESALLLSEINYQLYLNRQMQEQMLLTESVLILQNSSNVLYNSATLDYGKNSRNAQVVPADGA